MLWPLDTRVIRGNRLQGLGDPNERVQVERSGQADLDARAFLPAEIAGDLAFHNDDSFVTSDLDETNPSRTGSHAAEERIIGDVVTNLEAQRSAIVDDGMPPILFSGQGPRGRLALMGHLEAGWHPPRRRKWSPRIGREREPVRDLYDFLVGEMAGPQQPGTPTRFGPARLHQCRRRIEPGEAHEFAFDGPYQHPLERRSLVAAVRKRGRSFEREGGIDLTAPQRELRRGQSDGNTRTVLPIE